MRRAIAFYGEEQWQSVSQILNADDTKLFTHKISEYQYSDCGKFPGVFARQSKFLKFLLSYP